jgi:phosphoserine phosphatase
MYTKIKEGRIAYFDVDHTLVIWERDPNKLLLDLPEGLEESFDQICKADFPELHNRQPEVLGISHNGFRFWIRPVWTHVLQLIQQKMKGIQVVVWSASGSDWAEAVVNRLRLDDYVDLVVTKPDFYYDDSHPEGFMGKHFFFAWEEIDAKMGRKRQKHHDFRKDVDENLDD